MVTGPSWSAPEREWEERRIRAAFDEETNELIVRRLPVSVAIFLSFMVVAYLIEWLYYPERLAPLSACFAAFVVACFGGLALVRRFRSWAFPLTVALAILLSVILTSYLVLVHRSIELCLLGQIGFLTGVVVQFPWGAVGQLAVSGAVLGIYGVALTSDAARALPIPYGAFALATHAAMTVLGARLLERYRLSAFREATESAWHAAESARANAAKSEFLATVSHELRTPLNIIVGYTDLLMEEAFDTEEERRGALQRVSQQSRNLLDLIQSMLDLNRLEAGGIALVIEEFTLESLLERLRSSLPANWGKPGVDLRWKLSDGRARLRSDRGKIESVLRNLIHNALKYTEQGSVSVSADVETRRVRFAVTDTGQGIAEADLGQIFDMFVQGNSGPPRGGGVGLGLYIVSRLTRALGGEVAVESRLGEGSRFTVTIPLAAPSETRRGIDPDS
jgi:signal transduction histidine kinase